MKFRLLPEDIQSAIIDSWLNVTNMTLDVDRLSAQQMWNVLMLCKQSSDLVGKAHRLLFDIPDIKARLLRLLDSTYARDACLELLTCEGHRGDAQLIQALRLLSDNNYSLQYVKEVLQDEVQ